MADYTVNIDLPDHKRGDKWLGISSIGPVLINDAQPAATLARVRMHFVHSSGQVYRLDSSDTPQRDAPVTISNAQRLQVCHAHCLRFHHWHSERLCLIHAQWLCLRLSHALAIPLWQCFILLVRLWHALTLAQHNPVRHAFWLLHTLALRLRHHHYLAFCMRHSVPLFLALALLQRLPHPVRLCFSIAFTHGEPVRHCIGHA